jgi:hypothetical protein
MLELAAPSTFTQELEARPQATWKSSLVLPHQQLLMEVTSLSPLVEQPLDQLEQQEI